MQSSPKIRTAPAAVDSGDNQPGPHRSLRPGRGVNAAYQVDATTDRVIPHVPLQGRVTLSVNEACAVAGVSRSFIYDRMGDGTLASAKAGKRRLIRVDSLLELLKPAAA